MNSFPVFGDHVTIPHLSRGEARASVADGPAVSDLARAGRFRMGINQANAVRANVDILEGVDRSYGKKRKRPSKRLRHAGAAAMLMESMPQAKTLSDLTPQAIDRPRLMAGGDAMGHLKHVAAATGVSTVQEPEHHFTLGSTKLRKKVDRQAARRTMLTEANQQLNKEKLLELNLEMLRAEAEKEAREAMGGDDVERAPIVRGPILAPSREQPNDPYASPIGDPLNLPLWQLILLMAAIFCLFMWAGKSSRRASTASGSRASASGSRSTSSVRRGSRSYKGNR